MYRILLFLTITCVGLGADAQVVDPEEVVKERMLLKNVAFCQCLYQAYAELGELQRSDGSDSAYIKAGRYYLSAYDSTRALAKIYAERRYDDEGLEYGGFHGETLRIMKCFDFYYSEALDSLVRRLDKEINPEGSIDGKVGAGEHDETRTKTDSVNSID